MKRLGQYGFSLMSDAPNGRVWLYIHTGQMFDEDTAVKLVDDYENPAPVMDFQI